MRMLKMMMVMRNRWMISITLWVTRNIGYVLVLDALLGL